MKRAVLFIGHGTRDTTGLAEFHQFVDAVERTVAVDWSGVSPHKTPLFERCFLELQAPDITAAVASLHRRGATHVLIVPLLLFAAGHLKHDIPQVLSSVTDLLSDMTVECMDAVGVDDCFLQVAASRLHEAGFLVASPHAELVLVGRGNRDETAQRDFFDCAEHLRAKLGLRRVSVGYLAGSGKSLESALSEALAAADGPLYVLPYLWFHGWLTATLPNRIETWWKTQGGAPAVVIARHLGPDTRLVRRIAHGVLSRLSVPV